MSEFYGWMCADESASGASVVDERFRACIRLVRFLHHDRWCYELGEMGSTRCMCGFGVEP